MDKDNILVEVSARHVHLTQESVEKLFGEGAVLTPKKELTTQGLFAAKERVDVIGPRGTLHNVSILSPLRKYNQVEVSMTDARVLGLKPPFRESGDIEDTPGCTLIGPAGSIELDKGVIVSWRHMHVSRENAKAWGLESGDTVSIQTNEPGRSIIYDDVLVRVCGVNFVHIDTDEGNAGNIHQHAYGRLVGIKKKKSGE